MSDAARAAANAQRATAAVAALLAHGVRDLVVSPGSRSTPLVLAFEAARAAGLCDVHPVVDERAAAFFALGLSRASHAPVALVSTSGSAAGHWLPAFIEAAATGVPLIGLSANRPHDLHGAGAPQTVPQHDLFGAHARRFLHLPAPTPGAPDARWAAAALADAIAAAVGPHPGPVHIDLAFRKPLWSWSPDAPVVVAPATARHTPGRLQPDLDALEALAGRLSHLERGAIVAGPLEPAAARRIRGPLLDLAAHLGWPILADCASGLRFGARPAPDPVIAHHDALTRAPLDDAEIVLRVGRVPTSKPTTAWLARHAGRTVLLADDGQRHDPDHVGAELIAGDAAASLRALLSRVAPAPQGWLPRWRALDDRAAALVASENARETLWGGAIAHRLVARLPEGAALHLASSLPIRDVDSFAGASHRRLEVFASRGANGIDGTLATAFGEALRHPGPLALLVGDVAFLHDLASLATVAPALADRPVTIVIVDNGGGGIFDFLPIADGDPETFERYFLTPPSADIAALTRAFGVSYDAPGTPAELDAALDAALESPGVHVVHATIDREGDHRQHLATWRRVVESVEKGEL